MAVGFLWLDFDWPARFLSGMCHSQVSYVSTEKPAVSTKQTRGNETCPGCAVWGLHSPPRGLGRLEYGRIVRGGEAAGVTVDVYAQLDESVGNRSEREPKGCLADEVPLAQACATTPTKIAESGMLLVCTSTRQLAPPETAGAPSAKTRASPRRPSYVIPRPLMPRFQLVKLQSRAGAEAGAGGSGGGASQCFHCGLMNPLPACPPSPASVETHAAGLYPYHPLLSASPALTTRNGRSLPKPPSS